YFCRADHRFCAAAFCPARLAGCRFAFACFALPRWHCSPASTTLGRDPQSMHDQLLRRFLYLIHVASFLLDRVSVSVLLDWNGRWRHSRVRSEEHTSELQS